ncbi:hypothetical protein GCM10009841_02950 [Microlunatus panaciterrae]|uniref:CHRD domain-containing protein n=1 Tax=Microlunatus panaciterrae TaxID=400768 RepID=A0ABS2RJ76_9ACTN|nr:hypothetical protein [Microlunatus panaciterrae]MBM7799044.1 hypothetical protein [Microlunatus panaciterrae]
MSGSSLRRRVAAGALLALPLTFIGATAPASAHDGPHPVKIRLDPLKGSDAHGTATLTPTSSGGLKVHIHTTGMTPGMPHAQHIHGDTSGTHFFCPNDSADKDGSGFISVEEGLKMYGNIHISLTTKGDTSPDSGLAVDRFPVADKNGVLDYTRTISADQLPAGTLDGLHNLHIVQHGVDANGNDKYDLDGSGESTFAKSLGVKGIPAEATDGSTCGMVMPAGGVETGGESTSGVEDGGLIALGSVALLGAGAALLMRRRLAPQAD